MNGGHYVTLTKWIVKPNPCQFSAQKAWCQRGHALSTVLNQAIWLQIFWMEACKLKHILGTYTWKSIILFALYYSYCSELTLSVKIRSENLPIHLVFCLPKVVIKSMHKTKELRSDFVISDNVFGPIIIHASFRKIGPIVLPGITNQELDLKAPWPLISQHLIIQDCRAPTVPIFPIIPMFWLASRYNSYISYIFSFGGRFIG